MRSSLPEALDLIPRDGVGLDELARLANRVLDRSGIVVADGRVAPDVDGRTIRFYQTLGIVPKPTYEGRRAVYDREHLIRVVAARKLQSEGHSLAEIQGALSTRSTDELGAFLLSLEDARPESRAVRPEAVPPPATSGRSPSHPPALPTAPAMDPESGAAPLPSSPVALATFQLAPGVQVLIDPRRSSDPARLARDLLRALARSGHYSTIPAAASMTKPHGGRDPAAADGSGISRPNRSTPTMEESDDRHSRHDPRA